MNRKTTRRAPCAGLGKLLCRHHPERKARVNERLGQFVGCVFATRDDLIREPDLGGVGHAFVDAVKGATLKEVGRVNRVTCSPQITCERREPIGLTLRMVEQQNLCHFASVLVPGRRKHRQSPGRAFGNVP